MSSPADSMTEESLTTTIANVLDAHARLTKPANSLAATADLYAAGMSSHASVNVMIALEDVFDIQFPDRMLRKNTFASIAAISAAVVETLAVR